ncbi:AraC family transcriptional regulator [Tenacibaculum sp. SG-28]|uniref:AraC family transcriptional regulator n=1 Tax=Tenacibaculum sp. SG-28 TaxID=754426 RepID=UPI000CF580CA|nr:helix-turn-helix domain-containing protein [Tenacibaculum sp. SG-28]PQJ22910.1 transcriptional regulator [Tenacibaculum sp. SG-28]
MQKVKTYNDINATNAHESFAIAKMEAIYQKRNGRSDDPHRHDYFTILLVRKAKGIHKIDFNSYVLDNFQIYFVSPGQVHQVLEEEMSIGYVMTFSSQFILENNIPISFIESLNLFNDYGETPPLLPSQNSFAKVLHFVTEIFQIYHSKAVMKYLSIGAYLKLFLIECNAICEVNPVPSISDISENTIISKFKHLVNDNFSKEHSTSFYAELLHITPDHLNRVIKQAIGKTAKEYIQSRILIEAKRLLYFTQFSNKEIAYQLGFSEPANFSAYFKKLSGFSPLHFRKREAER